MNDDTQNVDQAEEPDNGITLLDMELIANSVSDVERPTVLVNSDILTLPSVSFNGFLNKLNGMQIKDVFKLPDNSVEAKRYQRLVRHASQINSKCDWDDALLTSKEWKQFLTSGDNKIGNRAFRVASSEDIGGEPLAVRIQERLGTGAPRSFPLYGSGFYVSIVPSSGTAMSNVMINVLERAEEIGGRTGGVAYDIGSTFVEQEILSHIFGNIRGSTINDVSVADIRNHIKASDYRRLIVGQLMANHPNGIIYDQPCVADVNKCQHISTAKLKLNTILRVAVGDFNETQLKHLQRCRNEVNLKDVKEYQESFMYDGITHLVSGEEEDDDTAIHITFHVPSIVDMHECYTSAINHLSKAIPDSLQNENDGKARRDYLDAQFRALPLISHLAWIKRITIGSIDSPDAIVAKDQETIRDVLITMCDSPMDDDPSGSKLIDSFLVSFNKYMTTIENDVVVKENKPCPNCGGVVKDKEGKALNFIPLEAESLFLAIAQFRQIASGRLNRYIL